MKIAFLGTMGIPARYGGLETCVDEVATRLVAQGHDVIVYCGYRGSKPTTKSYKGVQLVYIPCLANKFLDFPFRALISTIHVMSRGVDVAHYFGVEAWPFTIVMRIVSTKTCINLDGLVWNRSSYPIFVKKILKTTTGLAIYLPHKTIVDSKKVQKWYIENFNKPPKYVPYGANIDLTQSEESILNKYGLRNKKYILFVGRLVSEKGVHYLVEAFNKIKTDLDLVIVGGNPYENEYETCLKKNSNGHTKFLGYVYGSDCQNLYKGAYIYVTPSELEGTSPALLTALALGKCVLVSDIPENLETIGDAGFTFKHGNIEDLKAKLEYLIANPALVNEIQTKAISRIQKNYSWNSVTDQFKNIYQTLLKEHNKTNQ